MPVIWTDVVFSTLIIQTKSRVICLAEAWEGDYPAKSLDILLGSAHRDAIQSARKRGGPLPVCRSFAVAQDDSNRTKTAPENSGAVYRAVGESRTHTGVAPTTPSK